MQLRQREPLPKRHPAKADHSRNQRPLAPFAKLDPAKVRRFGELTPRIDNTGTPYAYQVKVGALARNEAGFCAFMQEAYGCTSAQAFLFDNYLKEWMAGEVEFPAENTADPRRVFEMNDGVFMQRRGDECTFFVQPDPSKPAKVFTSTKDYIAPDWEAATETLWVSSFNNGIEQAVGKTDRPGMCNGVCWNLYRNMMRTLLLHSPSRLATSALGWHAEFSTILRCNKFTTRRHIRLVDQCQVVQCAGERNAKQKDARELRVS